MTATHLPLACALLAAMTTGCDHSSEGASTPDAGTTPGDLATPNSPDLAPTADLAMPKVNPHPTVSSWLGTNISADLPYVDITHQLGPFDTAAAQKDANGYPVAGASGKSATDVGFILQSGMYKVSFKGGGALAVSGIGKLAGNWQSQNGEQRALLQITGTPGAFGNFLTLQITNGANQTVTDIRILSPGFDYDTKEIFLPQFVRLLAPFRALRFMDWEATNNSKLADWVDRPAAAHYGQSPFGQPYEYIVELVNQTGKDLWLTVPERATDDFAHAFAKFVAQNLDLARIQAARDQAGFTTPFTLHLETSNETWNGGFTAFGTFLAAAKAQPARYDGKYTGSFAPAWMAQNQDLMRVGQYEADRLVQLAAIFRTELAAIGKSDIVAPVLSGWALGAAYSDVGLRFIQSKYGDPAKLIRAVAIAPYFGPDDAQTGTLPALFAAAEANIASMDASFRDFAKLVAMYNLQMAAYEGGQGIAGQANQPIKHLAQHDSRMYQAYLDYFSLWKKDLGPSLFMHFSLAGDPGMPEFIYQYGYWGSIIGALEDPAVCGPNLPALNGSETIASVVHHCPKYRALAEQVP